MADKNILVSIWNYFTSNTETSNKEIAQELQEIIPTVEVIKPKRSINDVKLDDEDIKMFEEQEQKAYLEYIEEIFESEMLLLEPLSDLSRELSYDKNNAEFTDNYSIISYSETMENAFKNGYKPTLIKYNTRYLNFYESILFLKSNLTPKVSIPEINIKYYYGISTPKLKNILIIALTLGINITLHLTNIKIELKIANATETLDFIYFSKSYFPLVETSKTFMHLNINPNLFLTSRTQIAVTN
jgi:uncharacterized protein YihD (DUF1040 family)